MQTHPSAIAALRRMAADRIRAILAPPPKLTVSEWADRYRILSREASAEPGRWSTDRAPYAREMMDAFSDPLVEEVACVCASQTTKTEIVNNVVGYFIDQDPAPILVIEPTLEAARTWSLDRLAPMLRDTPRLKGKVSDAKARDSGNTITHKTFAGGHLTTVGANSPTGLAMRPIRVVLGDEVDRYPESAGTEGDPMDLGKKRATTFWNRKIGQFSSPSGGRIMTAYQASSRGRYFVPCPHCGLRQQLTWKGVRWESGKPETAQYVCGRRDPEDEEKVLEGCGALIDESQKYQMLRAGRWIHEDPGNVRVRGFHISALYSPWIRWTELARRFLDVKAERERLRVFINTDLAEVFREKAEELRPDQLGERRETYLAEVPAAVGVLTGAVDVHPGHLELLVRGWGIAEESYGIRQLRFYGDPRQREVWERLEVELTRPYEHELGAALRIRCVCIDSGDNTDAVYSFVRPRQGRGVWATKGTDVPVGRRLITTPGQRNRSGIRLWMLGVDAGKATLFDRLKIEQPGPGFMHFAASFDDEYFQQFGAEKRVRRHVRGYEVSKFVRDGSRRNEAIDLEVMALAALHILGPAVREHLAHWVEKARKDGEAAGGPKHRPPPPAEEGPSLRELRRPRPPGPRRGGWTKRF